MDLFFDDTIELHASYGYRTRIYMRNYLAMARVFLSTIITRFPARKITTLVAKDNEATLHFVEWLGFRQSGVCDDHLDKLMFELDKKQFCAFNDLRHNTASNHKTFCINLNKIP